MLVYLEQLSDASSLQTSALDSQTEVELMRNINLTLLDKQRTSIFIAHRLRTVVEAGKNSHSSMLEPKLN
jgi:hypothetical protein